MFSQRPHRIKPLPTKKQARQRVSRGISFFWARELKKKHVE
jgi:hypothetical protein